jgi:large subunit ribosomal protein L20
MRLLGGVPAEGRETGWARHAFVQPAREEELTMPRVKRGKTALRRRKKFLKEAKGYRGARSKTYRKARETLLRAWAYAYRDRKTKKRTMRSLWIVRVNAAARLADLSYSELMGGLKKAGIDLDRKVLADMAVHDPMGFKRIADLAKRHLSKSVREEVASRPREVEKTVSTHA